METDNLSAAVDVILGLRTKGYERLVAKQDLGLAGHNALRLWEAEILPAQRRWMVGFFSFLYRKPCVVQ